MGMAELTFVVPRMKVNGQYYHDVLCYQRSSMLQATRLPFNNVTSISSCKDTIKQLQEEMLDFIGPDLWPQNSPPESSGL